MAKKQKKDEVVSDVIAYVFDERSGHCMLQLAYDNIPLKGDNIVILHDGYVSECLVTKRSFVIDAETGAIVWNIYVVSVGSPYKLENSDETKNDNENNEKAN